MNRSIGFLRKLQNFARNIRLQLDFGDLIFNQAFNNSLHHKLEMVQNNEALAVASAIKGK